MKYAVLAMMLSAVVWFWRRRARKLQDRLNLITQEYSTLSTNVKVHEEARREKNEAAKKLRLIRNNPVRLDDAWGELRERDKNR